MKGKTIFYVVACFFPPVLLLCILTSWFHDYSFFLFHMLICLIFLFLLHLFVWQRYVGTPAQDLLTAIHRALKGDYEARFSCRDENGDFRELSASFNQFMERMENQAKELAANRHFQDQLLENERIYRSALELTCECVYEADLTHNRFLSGEETCRRAFPFLKTEIFDEMIKEVAQKAVWEEDRETFARTFSRESLLETLKQRGSTEINLEYRRMTPEGKTVWESSTVILLNSAQNEPRKIIGYIKNIDERKKQDLEILKMSQKDGLTGLYNKKHTQSLIEIYLANEGHSGTHAVIMLDIDNFKQINDTLGHIQGDAALSYVAQSLQGLFRISDITGRIGGDEFLILLKNVDSNRVLPEKLELIRCTLNEIRLEDKDYRLSGSIGVSLYPEDGTSYQELFQKADTALYYSKRHGKNQFRIYGEHDF